MPNKSASTGHTQESTGQVFTEANYLDAHFEAYRRDYEYMLRAVQLQPGWTVLDAGSGGGSFLPLIADIIGAEGTIHALDHAAENVEHVKSRVAQGEFACPVEVRQGSLLALPYPDHSVDAIWCANVVQYLTDVQFEQAIYEFRRVVRPGGIVAIKEFDLTGLYIAPVSPEQWWRVFAGNNVQGGDGIAAAMRTLDMPRLLAYMGFEHIRYQSVVSECRPPLTAAQRAYFGAITPFWYDRAIQADLSPDELEMWRVLFGELDGPQHVLGREDFYQREIHGLVVGTSPQDG